MTEGLGASASGREDWDVRQEPRQDRCRSQRLVDDDLPSLGGDTPYEQCLDEMALAGYEGTEMGSKYPTDPQMLNEALALRGATYRRLVLRVLHRRGRRTADARQLQALDPLLQGSGHSARLRRGGGALVPPAADPGPGEQDRFSTSTIGPRIVSGLEQIGRLATDNGLRIVYHHHGTEDQTQEDVERLMASTNPELVWLLLDTAHITVGGGDALAVAEKFAERICHVHLKNIPGRTCSSR